MEETYTPAAVQGSVPGQFQQLLHWTLSAHRSLVTTFQILTIPIGLLAAVAFFALALKIGRLGIRFGGGVGGTFRFDVLAFGAWLAVPAATIVLHELVHGVGMGLFGARPQYGARLRNLLFYATAPGYAFRRNAYVAVILAPLLVLSALAILGMYLLQGTSWVALLAVCAILNAGGSAGDMCMAYLILRHPRSAYIVDERDGFRVLLPKE